VNFLLLDIGNKVAWSMQVVTKGYSEFLITAFQLPICNQTINIMS
jgi:hypothetical protein